MEVVGWQDRRDLEAASREAFRQRWPEFIFHDATSKAFLPRVGEHFPQFDVLLIDGDAVLASAWGVPLRWDGTVGDLPDGYDGSLVRAVEGYEQGVQPTTLAVLAAAVAADATARGLAAAVLQGLRSRAAEADLRHVIVPVRPTGKHRYPLTPMAEYASWRREDGRSIDAWIRTHERMGAVQLGVASHSMVIEGTVAEWETWADMPFPASGHYVVPEALGLVSIDRKADRGTYVEENLWMQHR